MIIGCTAALVTQNVFEEDANDIRELRDPVGRRRVEEGEILEGAARSLERCDEALPPGCSSSVLSKRPVMSTHDYDGGVPLDGKVAP